MKPYRMEDIYYTGILPILIDETDITIANVSKWYNWKRVNVDYDKIHMKIVSIGRRVEGLKYITYRETWDRIMEHFKHN